MPERWAEPFVQHEPDEAGRCHQCLLDDLSRSCEGPPATENQNLWRVGRKVGRTIYMQLGPEPSDADVLIGVMDSPEIAAEAVVAHNVRLRGRTGGQPV